MTVDALKHLMLKDELPESLCKNGLLIVNGSRSLRLNIVTDPAGIRTQGLVVPLDYMKRMPEKVLAMLQSRLGMNQIVFARNCEMKKITRPIAENFIENYHLMGFTQSAFNYGLFYKNELLAVASFSKGRKMNRLPEDKRSFELIRFCCKSGISIAGGLTRLVRNFAIEKKAGDVMTYIDKQLSDGQSFIKAGFRKQGETALVEFLINRTTFERNYYMGEPFDSKQFYLIQNLGNLKLVYTLGE